MRCYRHFSSFYVHTFCLNLFGFQIAQIFFSVGFFPVYFVVALVLVDFLAEPTLINRWIFCVLQLHMSSNVFHCCESSITLSAAERLRNNLNNFHDFAFTWVIKLPAEYHALSIAQLRPTHYHAAMLLQIIFFLLPNFGIQRTKNGTDFMMNWMNGIVHRCHFSCVYEFINILMMQFCWVCIIGSMLDLKIHSVIMRNESTHVNSIAFLKLDFLFVHFTNL